MSKGGFISASIFGFIAMVLFCVAIGSHHWTELKNEHVYKGNTNIGSVTMGVAQICFEISSGTALLFNGCSGVYSNEMCGSGNSDDDDDNGVASGSFSSNNSPCASIKGAGGMLSLGLIASLFGLGGLLGIGTCCSRNQRVGAMFATVGFGLAALAAFISAIIWAAGVYNDSRINDYWSKVTYGYSFSCLIVGGVFAMISSIASFQVHRRCASILIMHNSNGTTTLLTNSDDGTQVYATQYPTSGYPPRYHPVENENYSEKPPQYYPSQQQGYYPPPPQQGYYPPPQQQFQQQQQFEQQQQFQHQQF